MADEIFIIGAGKYAAAIIDLAEACGYSVVGLYDDNLSKAGKEILGKQVLGIVDYKSNISAGANYVVAIGNNSSRLSISKKVLENGGIMPSLIHPKAEISRYARIGNACIVHAFTYIWTEAEIGNFSIISPNVVIAHHTKIGEGCLISTGASIGAGINIEERVLIGIGATVMTGVKKIGRASIVGAGSVVTKDIVDEDVVAGVPARTLHK